MNNMKSKEKVQLFLEDDIFKEIEAEGFSYFLNPEDIDNS